MKLKERIAQSIQQADDGHCPENYASDAGYGDHDWLSDWGAFLADRVVADLKRAGYVIRRARD